MTNLLHRNDEIFTAHNKYLKIPPSTSAHFANRVRRSRAVRLTWSSGFLMRAEASRMQASNSSGVSTFTSNPRSSSNPQTEVQRSWFWRFKQLYLGTYSELDTCSYELFFFSQYRYCHPQKYWPFSRGSFCTYYRKHCVDADEINKTHLL